jgi:hypothetical protein
MTPLALAHLVYFGVWRPFNVLRYWAAASRPPQDRLRHYRRVMLDVAGSGVISLLTLSLIVRGQHRPWPPQWPFLDWIDWGLPGPWDVAIAVVALATLAAADMTYTRFLRERGSAGWILVIPERDERPWWVALSAVTGVSEELTWRLVQPMLIHMLTGSAALAIALSAVAFGVGHLRGGWGFVGLTTLFGLVLQAVTLTLAGGWYLAALIHMGVNLAAGLRPLSPRNIPGPAPAGPAVS